MRFKQILSAIGFAALFAIGGAQASPITGSITVSDGVLASSLPTLPSTTIVSALLGISHDGNGNTTGSMGDFAGSNGGTNATMTDWVFGGAFPVDIIVVNGFTFHLTGISLFSTGPLVCVAHSCSDNLSMHLIGTVSSTNPLLDPSTFTGTLSFSDSCVSSDNVHCTSSMTAGYTYSLAATGVIETPEPASLALLGIALAGLGLVRRRRLG